MLLFTGDGKAGLRAKAPQDSPGLSVTGWYLRPLVEGTPMAAADDRGNAPVTCRSGGGDQSEDRDSIPASGTVDISSLKARR